MSKDGIASGFAFGYDPTGRSLFFLKMDRSTPSKILRLSKGSSRRAEYINSMFDVGHSTCPQCLDGGVSRIQLLDLYIDVNTNQMHYAWQAGVRCSFVSFSIKLTCSGSQWLC